MEESDDEFGNLSRFKILSFEEVNQGFKGNNAFANTIINKDNSPDYRSPFHDYRNTPLGYSYLTDDPVSVFPSTGINEKGEKGYEYRAAVLPCENGSQVLGSYNSNKREPQSLFLFYEKPNSKKSNFAGDFYAAKMGDYFVQLFKRFPEPLPSSVGGKFFKNIASLEDEAAYLAQLAYTYEGDKINATLVRDALMREYQFYTNDKQFDELLGNISQIPADAIEWCAAQLEDFKPGEKNYDPTSKDYSPLIPVFAGVAASENMNKAADFFEDLGSNPFVQGVETAFGQVWELVKQSASKVKDASIDHLPDSFKKLVTRITGMINTIKNFLPDIKDIVTDIAQKGIEFLKILNAFLCGIINGLVSLVQCILYILEFLLQPTLTFSYQQYLERRDLLEKAEDILDWVYENMPVFLDGVKNLFTSSVNLSQSDFENIFDQLKEYWDKTSRYTVAFYAGLIAFEFIINILLLIFTAGEGNVVKGATYVEKASSLLWVLTREAFSAATFGLTDLLLGLGKLITKFAQVCKKGWRYFIIWIEELLGKAKNRAKIDDVLEEIHDIEEVIINGKKLQKGSGDITKSFAENAEIKIEKWISETKVFGQSTDHTCVATSLKMVLEDKSIVKSEEYLAGALNTTKDGARIKDIPDALYTSYIDDVVAIYEEKIKFSKLIEKLTNGDRAIVSIGTKEFGSHAVVLEKVENGKVFLRDPLPMNQGTSYAIKMEDFEKIFKDKAVIIKK